MVETTSPIKYFKGCGFYHFIPVYPNSAINPFTLVVLGYSTVWKKNPQNFDFLHAHFKVCVEIGILIKDILSGVVSIYYRFKIRAYIFLECLWVYLKKKRLPCYQRFSNAVSLLLAWKCKCKCKKENGNKLKYTIVLCTGKRFLLREFDFLWPSPSWPFYRLATTTTFFQSNFCSFKVKLFFGA